MDDKEKPRAPDGQYSSHNRDESPIELTNGPVLKICKSCGREIEHLGDFPGPLCLQCYRDSDDAKQAWEAEDIRAAFGMKRNRRSTS